MILAIVASVVAAAYFVGRPIRVWHAIGLGRAALKAGDFSSAASKFRAAESIDPQNPEIQFWLARVSRKQGDFNLVRERLSQARELGFEDAERLDREWRLTLAQAGFIDQVESYYSHMLANPGDDGVEICEAFANGFCLNLRFGEAIALLDAWKSDFPNDHRPYLFRAQMFAGQNEWRQAREQFEAALALSPEDPETLIGLAQALHALNVNDVALQHIQHALKHVPKNIDALLHAANIATRNQTADLAFGYLRSVMELDRGNFAARLQLAKLLHSNGQAGEALELAEGLIDEWPEDLAALYFLAQALRSAGRASQSDKLLEKYATLAETRNVLARLQRELDADPGNAELRFQLGDLTLRHVSRPDGVAWLESVLLVDPSHAKTRHMLVEYFRKIGDEGLAIQYMTRQESDF